MKTKTLLAIGTGVTIFGLAMAAASNSGPGADVSWHERVIARVSGHEGSYGSQNRNADGAGLSFGILQWAQKPGQLGVLLVHLHAADPVLFEAVFGETWPQLLGVTAQASLEPVPVRANNGEMVSAVLWKEPWTSRFKAAGKENTFRRAQLRLAREGEHFQGALKAAVALGIPSERALTLLFDRSVQQGPAMALKLAQQAAATGLPYRERLQWLANKAASRYYSASKPSKLQSGRGDWRQASDGSWHYWVGKFNLYTGITNRSRRILTASDISDAMVRL